MVVGVFPIWEGRKTIAHTSKSIYLDIIGRRKPHTMFEGVEATSQEDTTQKHEKIIAKV